MELLSIEYGDMAVLCQAGQRQESRSACLKVYMAVDPILLTESELVHRILGELALTFPGVCNIVPACQDLDETETVAYLTGSIILDLQRDLCEWPSASFLSLERQGDTHEYELCVESIDERVGRFSAHLAVNVMRMMLLEEHFDPRLIWVIDLVRLLRRQPRLRLSPKRVAAQLGCSMASAEWTIPELERYGYVSATKVRRFRRATAGRILVVDDSAQIRDLLSRILETLGYDVITAVDGEEGIILLDWTSYKAVFVDLLMPCMDGFTFLKQARAQGIACPLFVVSAYEHRWKPEDLRAAGASDFLPKPFSLTEIEALLKKHIK